MRRPRPCPFLFSGKFPYSDGKHYLGGMYNGMHQRPPKDRTAVALPRGTAAYLYAYLSNETGGTSEAHFDDMRIGHERLVPDNDRAGRTYRFAFNGKERDLRDFGKTTAYDYGFRIYSPAVAKFLSVDPLMSEYPWFTPYQFAGNRPIDMIDLDGAEGMHHIYLMETQARNAIKKTGDKKALESFNKSMMKMNNYQLGVTAVTLGVVLDLYLTKGKITKELLNQFKTQVIANATIEATSLILNEKGDYSSVFKNTLTKSLQGVDGADAIVGVFVKDKKLANALAAVVDFSINPETGKGELKSIVKGKSVADIAIDIAFNFITDAAGEKISNTKFSGPVKEAFDAAGIDLNNLLKDIVKPKENEKIFEIDGVVNESLMLDKTVEGDATRVAPTHRKIDD